MRPVPGAVATGSAQGGDRGCWNMTRSHSPPHAGCPRADPGPLQVLPPWPTRLTQYRESSLLHPTLAPAQKIDQHKLRKIVWIGKVSFAVGHRGHLLDELDQIIITGEHEGINHDAGFATGLDFAERCFHYKWIAAH